MPSNIEKVTISDSHETGAKRWGSLRGICQSGIGFVFSEEWALKNRGVPCFKGYNSTPSAWSHLKFCFRAFWPGAHLLAPVRSLCVKVPLTL